MTKTRFRKPRQTRAQGELFEGTKERVVDPRDVIPDARDGLTRVERIILFELQKAQRELGGRRVPTAMLYGRVVEHDVDLRSDEFQLLLAKLTGRGPVL